LRSEKYSDARLLIASLLLQVKELPKSMLAAKSFNVTSQSAQLDKWMQILAEELAERLAEDSELNARRPRTLTLYYR